jgi:hypothetical protein
MCFKIQFSPVLSKYGLKGLLTVPYYTSQERGFSPLWMNDTSLDGTANQMPYHTHIPGIYTLTAMHELMSRQILVDQHTSRLWMLITMKALMFHQMTVELMCNLTYHGNMDAQHHVLVVDVSS